MFLLSPNLSLLNPSTTTLNLNVFYKWYQSESSTSSPILPTHFRHWKSIRPPLLHRFPSGCLRRFRHRTLQFRTTPFCSCARCRSSHPVEVVLPAAHLGGSSPSDQCFRGSSSHRLSRGQALWRLSPLVVHSPAAQPLLQLLTSTRPFSDPSSSSCFQPHPAS